jgi:sodium-dependent dicarboxylate transporter 2/3/5
MTRPFQATTQNMARWAGLIGSPLLAVGVYMALSQSTEAGELPESGRRVIALGVLMAGWWLTEALPLAATALLPLAALPLLNVAPIGTAAAPYAEDLIFLFLGGFLLGRAFEKSGLHRRVALLTLMAVGVRPGAVVAGVMVATALISMWVSNTATAIMMLPIVASLIALVEHSLEKHGDGAEGWDTGQVHRFSMALLLGLAYAASIGGIGTPLGTPPNLQFASNARELFGDDFSFVRWARVGVPVVALLLPLAWALLVLVLYRVRAKRIPGGKAFIRGQLKALGRMRTPEVVTLVVFLVAVTLWIGRKPLSAWLGREYTGANGKTWLPLTDAGIGVIAALVLFMIPAGKGDEKDGGGAGRRPVLRAEDVDRVPWSILLLFGGGLSLAAAMKSSGVDLFLGKQFSGLEGLPTPVLLLVIVASITLLSELASNTAVAATTLPVLAAAAEGMGVHPYTLMIPATLAASCGFMLPVATPPNAIVFASGRLTIRQMARAGILMDVVAVVTIVVFMWIAGPWVVGVE